MALSYGFCLGATGSLYDSKQFAEIFYALVGNGICPYGGKFSITVNNFTVNVSPGFALVHGRWVKNDKTYQLTLPSSGNYADRYDAIAVQVDYGARKTSLEVLVDINPAAVRENPALIQNERECSLILYFVHIKRGATELHPENFTDTRGDASLCGYVTPMTAVSGDTLDIYEFLTSGIDEEMARILSLSNDVIVAGSKAIENINGAILKKGTTEVGEILLSKSPPSPMDAWLLCDGSGVPAQYTALSAMLGGVLPNVIPTDTRFKAYIYSGLPA